MRILSKLLNFNGICLDDNCEILQCDIEGCNEKAYYYYKNDMWDMGAFCTLFLCKKHFPKNNLITNLNLLIEKEYKNQIKDEDSYCKYCDKSFYIFYSFCPNCGERLIIRKRKNKEKQAVSDGEVDG